MVLSPQTEKSNHLTFSAVFCRTLMNVPLTVHTSSTGLVTSYKHRHMQACANEDKISRDLKITAAGAAVIQDADFVLVVYLCCDRRALEEHF